MGKLVRCCTALAAIAAFAILPVAASAENNPRLTEAPLPAGAKIIAPSVGSTLFTDTSGNPLVTCSNAKLAGSLLNNSAGGLEVELTTFDFQGTGTVSAHNGLAECTGSFGNAYVTIANSPLCLRSTSTMATYEFQVSSSKCSGGGKVRFIIGSTTVGECEYETAGMIKGNYKTTPSELIVRNTVAGSGASKIRGGFLCPSSGMLKMSFSLETEGGTPIAIS
jgi:hypothetical protein